MKEYYYEKDNKAYIIDDNEGIIIEDAKDNTEETLIVENNIEQIEDLIKVAMDKKDVMEYHKNSTHKKTMILIILCLILMVVTLGWASTYMTLSELGPMLFVSGFVFILPVAIALSDMDLNKDIKYSNIYIEELKQELEKENEKFKSLKASAKNKIVESSEIKEIPKSEIIENLKRKKDLITNYFNHRKKYISSYKDNTLDDLFKLHNYSESDIKLVKSLIEEDLKNENVKTDKKSKQKIK